jgi:hypothetical protein
MQRTLLYNSRCCVVAHNVVAHGATLQFFLLHVAPNSKGLRECVCVFLLKRLRESEREKETSPGYVTPLILALLVDRSVIA